MTFRIEIEHGPDVTLYDSETLGREQLEAGFTDLKEGDNRVLEVEPTQVYAKRFPLVNYPVGYGGKINETPVALNERVQLSEGVVAVGTD